MKTATMRALRDAAPDCQRGASPLKLRSALEIVNSRVEPSFLIGGLLETQVLAIMFGEMGAFKSFLALDWALHLAAGRAWLNRYPVKQATDAVYISAEGRGLRKRINGWAKHHEVDLAALRFYALEHVVDLSRSGLTDLVTSIDSLGVKPKLIVIDTLSQNAGTLDEDKAKDMALFLSSLDKELCLKFGASVLLVHHVGHGAKDRARGSYALLANTGANYRVEFSDRPQRIIRITTGRVKDAESPEPIQVAGEVVDVGTVDVDGNPESTIVLVPTMGSPVEHRKRLTGRNQKQLLAELERRALTADGVVWQEDELRAIARAIGMHKNSARDAVSGLSDNGCLVNTPDGFRLVFTPGGTKDRKKAESSNSCAV